MKQLLLSQSQLLLLLLLFSFQGSCRASIAHDFPSPVDPACHSFGSQRVCNTDELLTAADIASIDSAIDQYEYNSQMISCRGVPVEIQLGVFIENHSVHGSAQSVATSIHNEWGVGFSTDCGGTGLLIYLAIQDHQMYFSRGAALQSILNDQVLQEAMVFMNPLLRQNRYGDAIEAAILDLTYYTSGLKKVQNPTTSSNSTRNGGEYNYNNETIHVSPFWPMFVLFVAWVYCYSFDWVWNKSKEERERLQQKEKVKQCLRDMDTAHQQVATEGCYKVKQCLRDMDAAHLQVAMEGRYKANSCAICLQRFSPYGCIKRAPINGETTAPATASATLEDDDYNAPVAATIAVTALTASMLEEDDQPMMATEKTPLVTATAIPTGAPLSSCAIQSPLPGSARRGSDGKPVQRLPCGHVFDDTCIGNRVTMQREQGQIPTCPVCNSFIIQDDTGADNCDFFTGSAFDANKYHQERVYRLQRLQENHPVGALPPQHLLTAWVGARYQFGIVGMMSDWNEWEENMRRGRGGYYFGTGALVGGVAVGGGSHGHASGFGGGYADGGGGGGGWGGYGGGSSAGGVGGGW